jgi:hypothetical protein
MTYICTNCHFTTHDEICECPCCGCGTIQKQEPYNPCAGCDERECSTCAVTEFRDDF